MAKPSVFVGSSREGLEIARAIQTQLYEEGEIEIWNEGVFGLTQGTLESLVAALDKFDFAILVLTPDDLTISRGAKQNSARDNILIELGLFLGRLGRERTFIVTQKDSKLRIPTDLAGVTFAYFLKPNDEEGFVSEVGPACSQIRRVIKAQGRAVQLRKVVQRQDSFEAQLHTLQVVTKGIVTAFELEKLQGLANEGSFLVRFHWEMIAELKRLDAIRYIKPRPNYGIISIHEREGSQTEFDLKQYVQITTDGLEYLKLREDLFGESS